MSWEIEEHLSLGPTAESSSPLFDQKKQKIRYTKDFCLSLRDLDVCKKLPCGIDKSIISDLEEAYNTGFERQRSVGKLSSQGSKRGEYCLQSNLISCTKGNSTRWDTRTSGSSDGEGDLQSERESYTQDPRRRYENQNRRTWQPSEHDGLLGSGALVRPPGFSSSSNSKTRGMGQYQLNRSAEPYQPPRPYKAPFQSRKVGNDFCNDETFGSSGGSNEDRVEEERKRRESFELLRREQQKGLQEKPSIDIDKQIIDLNIAGLADSSDMDKTTNSRSKAEDSASIIHSSIDPLKSSLIHNSAARPLVPPGFASALLEKNLKMNKLKIDAKQPVDELEGSSATSLFASNAGFDKKSANTSGLEVVDDSLHNRETSSDSVDAATSDHSTSFFEKLFKYSLMENTACVASDNMQNHTDGDDEELCTEVTSESSKFVHLFLAENKEKMHIQDKPSIDLLSLIINNDKFGSQVNVLINDEAADKNKLSRPFEYASVLSSPACSPIARMPLEFYQTDEQRPCSVLTCEDLEQSIMAEVKDRRSVVQYLEESWTSTVDPKCENHNDVVNDHASHHLLSLLQRGENSKEPLESSRMDDAIGSLNMHVSPDAESNSHLHSTDSTRHSKTLHNSENVSTLESLFGSAFMSELHSMEAPISAQKILANDSSAFHSYGLPLHLSDGLTSTTNEQNLEKAAFEGETVQLNIFNEHRKLHLSAGNWRDFRDSSLHGFKFGDLVAEHAVGDILLPEEDNLISLNDSLNTAVVSDSLSFQNLNRNESSIHDEMMTEGHSDNLLNTILKVGQSSRESTVDYPSSVRASLQKVDSNDIFHHLQARPSLQASHQMSHGSPSFTSHLDYPMLRNSHLTFVNQDSLHHDHAHPFNPDVFAHPSYESNISPHFEHISAHHNSMLQPLPLSGKFTSNSGQVIQCVPYPINQGPNFVQEMNAFPLHYQQPYLGALGMGIPGHGSVSAAIGMPSHEKIALFERLKEMEMRANSKQFHLSTTEHLPGLFYD